MRRTVFAVASAAIALSAATRAHAAPAPNTSAEYLSSHGLHGIEIALRGGLAFAGGTSPVTYAPSGSDSMSDPGGVFSGTLAPYQVDEGGSIAIGWRFVRFASAGAFVEYQPIAAGLGTQSGDAADGTANLQRAIVLWGAYGRFYWTEFSPQLHPWIEVGVGLSDDLAKYSRPVAQGPKGPTPADYVLEEHGVALPLAIGLDWRVGSVGSIGPMLAYRRVLATDACVNRTVNERLEEACTANAGDAHIVQGGGYGWLYFGVFLKLTVGPEAR